MNPRRGAELAALAVLLVVGTGCGTVASCAGDHPLTGSSPTSPAEQFTPEQSVRAWVKAYNQVARSANATTAHDLQTRDCRTCDRLIRSLVETVDAGGSYRGGQWRVRQIHLESRSTAKAVVHAVITMTAGSIRDRMGAGFRHFGANRDVLEFRLEDEDGRWSVSFVGWLS